MMKKYELKMRSDGARPRCNQSSAGRFQGAAFKNAGTLSPRRYPELLSIGKETYFRDGLAANQIHEEEAAIRIAQAIHGANLTNSAPSRGV